MNRKVKIGIVGILLLAIMIPAAMAASAAPTNTNKGDTGQPPTNVAKTYLPTETVATTAGTVATTTATTTISPQIAWVKYGPISVEPYRNRDWYVSYGGNLAGIPVTVVSLSIPWSSNGVGHRYSINTESNYMYNSGAWVQVSSGDDFGIPAGTFINLIGIY